VIKNAQKIEELERDFISRHRLSYEQSLRIFTSLWQEGQKMGVLPPANPLEGFETDLRVARILNTCLKSSSQR
jgi:hypothetical protein